MKMLLKGFAELATSYNKIYLLRSLRCRSSSRARPYAPEDRGQSTSGTLVLCFAARRSGQIYGASKRGFPEKTVIIVRRTINFR
ncbi:hypothetical protein [Turneriella parva]|uniref:Uncharacterized protein n=1 Tax=Turneriella parva (strain ATCC BAA-1111 / DSM 21527 / NCTC 11395 / H) TaxID=869212 RepID=I4B9T1_TURPD|nr:hypothetical protein [Turneriella parva]AFM14038.1 hypothetical protein Turpa_3401 [Turneriella parva DSM 21527]